MPPPRPRRVPERSAGDPVRVRMDGTTSASPDANKPGGRVDVQKNTSYERYKQQLHAFFNGEKPLPDHLKDMLATRPGASEHGFGDEAADADVDAAGEDDKAAKKQKKDSEPKRRVVAASAEDIVLAEAIRKATSPKEVQTAVDALLARGFPLPKDADILGKALGHSDDGVLEQALAGLLALVEEGSFKGNGTLLKTRVKNVKLLSTSTAVQQQCNQLMQRL